MFTPNEVVVYQHNICRVVKLLPRYRNDQDYYHLVGTLDTSLHIHTPVALADRVMRPVISKPEAEAILRSLENQRVIATDSDTVQQICNKHIQQGDHQDLLRVIKTHQQHVLSRAKTEPKMGESDKSLLHNAEDILYRELGAVLGQATETIRQTVYDHAGPAKSLAA